MKLRLYAITEDKSIDWYFDVSNGVYALNTETMMFENVSDFCGKDGYVVAIDNNYLNATPAKNDYDFDEAGISKKIAFLKENGTEIAYTLYTKNTKYLVGYVYKN